MLEIDLFTSFAVANDIRACLKESMRRPN